jgi:hypothetical protein
MFDVSKSPVKGMTFALQNTSKCACNSLIFPSVVQRTEASKGTFHLHLRSLVLLSNAFVYSRYIENEVREMSTISGKENMFHS